MSAKAQSETGWCGERRLVPTMKGVDRSEVEVDEDGTHRGPPVFRGTDKTTKDSTKMAHPVLEMYCPCGHLIREVSGAYTDHPNLQTVECEGKLPDL